MADDDCPHAKPGDLLYWFIRRHGCYECERERHEAWVASVKARLDEALFHLAHGLDATWDRLPCAKYPHCLGFVAPGGWPPPPGVGIRYRDDPWDAFLATFKGERPDKPNYSAADDFIRAMDRLIHDPGHTLEEVEQIKQSLVPRSEDDPDWHCPGGCGLTYAQMPVGHTWTYDGGGSCRTVEPVSVEEFMQATRKQR